LESGLLRTGASVIGAPYELTGSNELFPKEGTVMTQPNQPMTGDRSNDTHTADGVKITPGLWVWNNNLDSVQVTPEQFATPEARERLFRQADPTATIYSQVWYDTTGGIFNGTRMATVFEGLHAADYPGMSYGNAKRQARS
jgi:hypothetical protein